MSEQQLSDAAASFQAAVVDVLVEKTMRAVRKSGVKTVVVGGGVAANSRLRAELASAGERAGLALHLTPMAYCTDNGAMIAYLGGQLLSRGRASALDVPIG